MKIDSDPFRAVDDRLDRWGRWRRGANYSGAGGYANPLAKMQGEATAIARGERKVRYGLESAQRVRTALKNRILDLSAIKPEDRTVEQSDEIERLRRQFRAAPSTTGQLPWASMIHGHGARIDPEMPEEEDTERFFMSLPRDLRRVMHRNWVNTRWLSQEENAREMGIGYSTFKERVKEIKRLLLRWGTERLK